MPLYDYRCDNCGHRFEEMRGVSDTKGVSCPLCASVAKRLVTCAAVHGLKKGPGCGSGQLGNMVRYDLKKEAQIVGQKMEEAGAFSGPDGATTYAAFKKKHDSIMNRPDHLTSFDREKSDNA